MHKVVNFAVTVVTSVRRPRLHVAITVSLIIWRPRRPETVNPPVKLDVPDTLSANRSWLQTYVRQCAEPSSQGKETLYVATFMHRAIHTIGGVATITISFVSSPRRTSPKFAARQWKIMKCSVYWEKKKKISAVYEWELIPLRGFKPTKVLGPWRCY